jgi:uncharacterized RDD family membrane protein YckC
MARSNGAGARAARRLEGENILFRRWAGCWIDFIAAAVLLVVAAAPFAGVSDAELTDQQALTIFFVGIAVVFTYYAGLEAFTGRTLGKLVTGTIVVDAEGKPPGLWRALVRTLLRLLEVNPFLLGGIPAGVAVALTQDKRRLGDMAAGTYVVSLKSLQKMTATPAIADVFD